MYASAIVVAAGSGSRLGAGTPKAFVPFGGSTLLAMTLRTIGTVASVAEVVIAVPSGMEPDARREAVTAGMSIPVKTIAGGKQRQDSVRIALALTSAEAELVLIHDAARPLATVAMFEQSLAQAEVYGAAIVAIPVADTLKRVLTDGTQDVPIIAGTVPRSGLWQAQTPQAFKRSLLIEAHTRALRSGIEATDDADLVEQIGVRAVVVPGSPLNLKVTTADDRWLVETIATARLR